MFDFLEQIRLEWSKSPDMRFGQLLYCFFSETGDPFNWEEDEFIQKLKEYMGSKPPHISKSDMSKAEAKPPQKKRKAYC